MKNKKHKAIAAHWFHHVPPFHKVSWVWVWFKTPVAFCSAQNSWDLLVVSRKAVAEVSKVGTIREVFCCESCMAKRARWWIERWLDCRAICLSVCLSICLSSYLSIELSSIYLSVCLCACLSVYLSVFLPVKLSICLSVYLWWRCLLYPPSFLKLLQNRHVFLTFGKVLNPFPLPHRMAIEPPKMPTTWTCDVFTTFDFEMCFAPQRPALFHYLNFQSVPNMWCCYHFWLRNVLRATTALFQRVSFQKWSGTEALSCFFMFFLHFDFDMCFALKRRALF